MCKLSNYAISIAISNPTFFFSTFASTAGRRVLDHKIHDSSSNSASSNCISTNGIIQSSSIQMSAPYSSVSEDGYSASSVLNSSEYRGVIEYNNRQNKLHIHDDSMDSCSRSSLSSNSYAKRLSVGEADVENVQNPSRCVLLNSQRLIKY